MLTPFAALMASRSSLSGLHEAMHSNTQIALKLCARKGTQCVCSSSLLCSTTAEQIFARIAGEHFLTATAMCQIDR